MGGGATAARKSYMGNTHMCMGVLDSAPPDESIILLGDFNGYVDNNSESWRGVIWMNNPPSSEPECCVIIGHLCKSLMSIMNAMFKHEDVHWCNWH